MKKNTILFILLAALATLVSSCDNKTVATAGKDGDGGGKDGFRPRSSTDFAINISKQDNNTLAFYFREPIGTVAIAIENSNGELLAQQEVNTSETALAEIGIAASETNSLNIKITDTRNNIIYQRVYNME